jgi:hypothetical protein
MSYVRPASDSYLRPLYHAVLLEAFAGLDVSDPPVLLPCHLQPVGSILPVVGEW